MRYLTIAIGALAMLALEAPAVAQFSYDSLDFISAVQKGDGAKAGQLLNEGESVGFNGHVFKVEEVDKRRITKVRMQKTES